MALICVCLLSYFETCIFLIVHHKLSLIAHNLNVMNRCDHAFMHAALFWGSVLAQAIMCVSCIHAPAYSHTPRYSSTTTATARVSPSKPSAFVQAHLLWAQNRAMQLQLRGSVCDRRRCEKANVATQLSPSDNHARMALLERPMLILVGSPAEGKQELGRALARRLDVNFVNGMELSSEEEADALCGLCQDPSANLTRSASNRINLKSRTLAAVITSSAAGEEAYREADTPLLQHTWSEIRPPGSAFRVLGLYAPWALCAISDCRLVSPSDNTPSPFPCPSCRH